MRAASGVSLEQQVLADAAPGDSGKTPTGAGSSTHSLREPSPPGPVPGGVLYIRLCEAGSHVAYGPAIGRCSDRPALIARRFG